MSRWPASSGKSSNSALRSAGNEGRFRPNTRAENRGAYEGGLTMIELSRRNLLTAAAAAGAASALTPFAGPAARAAVPPAAAQAPGFYRYKVGSYECTSINDGARSFPLPDSFVTNVPKAEAAAAAEAAYMPQGMVTVPFNPQLINTGSKLILIDSGNGIAA